MKVGTATHAATTQLNLQFCPQYLSIAGGTVTSVKVDVLGAGTILDLDANGLAAVGYRDLKAVTSGTFLLPLADGLVKNKTLVITIVNTHVSADADVCAFSYNEGSVYIKSETQTVLANNNPMLYNFAQVWLPNLASGDKVTCEFADGTNQIFEREELGLMSTLQQATSQYLVDNKLQTYSNIRVLVATTQSVYVMTYQKVSEYGK